MGMSHADEHDMRAKEPHDAIRHEYGMWDGMLDGKYHARRELT